MPDNIPKHEEVGLPKTDGAADTLEALRSDVEALKSGIKTDVVNAFREELKQLQKPNTDKAPAPDLKRVSDVRVTGHAGDILYRGLPAWEQKIRNPKIDALTQQWLIATRQNHREKMDRLAEELNDLYRANELTEGTSSVTGGIGSGSAADLVPFPVAATIVEYRNRRAKIRPFADVYTSPNQSLRVPRHGRMTAEMVAEGESASNTGDSLDTVLLSKKKMQVRFSITDELLEDSAFNVVGFFTRRAGEAMAQLEDEEFCTVRGDSASITQALEAIGGENRLNTLNAFGLLGYKDLARLAFALPEQYTDNARWFGNATALGHVSTLLDSTGRPVFVPALNAAQIVGDQIAGNVGTLFGRPVSQLPMSTSGTAGYPKSDIWLGDLKFYAILDGGGFRVKTSEHVEFNNGRVVWKVEQRVDGALLNSEAFARMTISGTVA